MTLRDVLKKYIQENLVQQKGVQIADNDSLVEHGVLDSLALLNLMNFIEEKTGVRIPDDEVLLENFETVASIEQTVDRLRGSGRGH